MDSQKIAEEIKICLSYLSPAALTSVEEERVEAALRVVGNLAASDNYRGYLCTLGGIEVIAGVMAPERDPVHRMLACVGLGNLALFNPQTQTAIGATPNLLENVLQLLHDEDNINSDIIKMVLRLLAILTTNNPENKRRIASLGFVQYLAKYLEYDETSSARSHVPNSALEYDEVIIESTVEALRNLFSLGWEVQALFCGVPDSIKHAVGLLGSESPLVQHSVAFLLYMLTTQRKEVRQEMVKHGAVPLLARLLMLNPNVKTQEMAMQVLMNISSDTESHPVMLQNGVLFPLIDLMKNPQSAESVQLAVVRTLVNTVEDDEMRKTILRAGGIPPVVHFIKTKAENFIMQLIPLIIGLTFNGNVRVVLKAEGAVPAITGFQAKTQNPDIKKYLDMALHNLTSLPDPDPEPEPVAEEFIEEHEKIREGEEETETDTTAETENEEEKRREHEERIRLLEEEEKKQEEEERAKEEEDRKKREAEHKRREEERLKEEEKLREEERKLEEAKRKAEQEAELKAKAKAEEEEKNKAKPPTPRITPQVPTPEKKDEEGTKKGDGKKKKTKKKKDDDKSTKKKKKSKSSVPTEASSLSALPDKPKKTKKTKKIASESALDVPKKKTKKSKLKTSSKDNKNEEKKPKKTKKMAKTEIERTAATDATSTSISAISPDIIRKLEMDETHKRVVEEIQKRRLQIQQEREEAEKQMQEEEARLKREREEKEQRRRAEAEKRREMGGAFRRSYGVLNLTGATPLKGNNSGNSKPVASSSPEASKKAAFVISGPQTAKPGVKKGGFVISGPSTAKPAAASSGNNKTKAGFSVSSPMEAKPANPNSQSVVGAKVAFAKEAAKPQRRRVLPPGVLNVVRPEDERTYIRRRMIAQEILETEEFYVNSIAFLISKYYRPLVEVSTTSKKILTPEQVHEIFSSIEVIQTINAPFLDELKDEVDANIDAPLHLQLGGVFKCLAERLKDYATFVNNFDHAAAKIHKITTKHWVQFLKETREHNKKEINMHLEGLLIMPVQRVPRYNLLLTDLHKHTPSTHIDHRDLGLALDKIRDVANYINEAKRQAEQHQAMILITTKVQNYPETLGDLFKPGRVYIRQGHALHYRKKGSSRYLYLFLLSDLLLITIQKKKDRYDFVDSINIKTMKFTSLPDTKELQNAFSMSDDKKEFTFFTSTPFEKENWVDAFVAARESK